MPADSIAEALAHALQTTRTPGGVVYVGDLDRTHVHEAQGFRALLPEKQPARKDTLYDLASLTKVVATTTAVMLLRDAGQLRLHQPVTDFVPESAFNGMTPFHLLTHTAGFIPWKPYYETETSVEAMLALAAKEGIEAPPGLRSRYSDFSYMLLGLIVEAAAKDRFDAFCRKEIFEPLEMARTAFRPPEAWKENVAATEDCPWRKKVIVGEVHDQNAWAAGGIAGHAGLFSTAEDLAKFCRALLGGRILRESSLAEMTRLDLVPSYPWQGLGWQLDPWRDKATGYLPSRFAFGHTGWTGTSLWLDRSNDLFAILLANTCHPSTASRNNPEFRRIVHDAIAARFYPKTTNTHTGLSRVLKEDFDAVNGNRVALLTHAAAVDMLGRPIVDVLSMAPDMDLRLLYSPEHGLHGQAEAGAHVSGQSGPVPVVSLYGERLAPTPEELAQVDLFIVDLQDVGARYYTYGMTLKRCLEACAAANKPVLVLDRPNPLGGDVLEGPVAENTTSDVCWGAVPIRHGMTIGELARFFEQTDLRAKGLDLSVQYLDNWTPEKLHHQCSLPWAPPSPNIPAAEAALLYVGMCLFEGTNLNEGRGTETPFALVGAPWVDAAAVVAELKPLEMPGLRVEPVEYTPTSIPGKASNPKYAGETCRGVRLAIERPHEVRAFTTVCALIQAMRTHHAAEFAFNDFFNTLAGGPDLRRRLEAGEDALAIEAAYETARVAYNEMRPQFYRNLG